METNKQMFNPAAPEFQMPETNLINSDNDNNLLLNKDCILDNNQDYLINTNFIGTIENKNKILFRKNIPPRLKNYSKYKSTEQTNITE